MLAIIAAVIFGLAFLLDIAGASLGALDSGALLLAGLLCVALHMAGVGAGARSLSFRRRH